jgi:Cu+-exporting ATPase
MATDPVCGMYVPAAPGSLRLVRDNRTYYFCSETCFRTFAEPEHERQRLLRRLAVAWPLSVVVLVLTYAPAVVYSSIVTVVLAAVVQFYPGSVFYRGTYDALRHRTANMDILIAVATSAAFAYSIAVLALPGRFPSALYFDASALIITLILTGNYLEHLARGRAGSALQRLGEVLPSHAELLRAGSVTSVPLSEVRPGDRIRVRPGGRFPADGVVRSGTTTADESLLTGESLPVPKGPTDRVLAGAVNGPGAVEVEATGVGTDTFLATVGRLLSDAEMSRVPLQRTADRISATFAPAVLALALASAIGWFFVGGAAFTTALLVFVTVAITACPCAFGIATPAAILVGTGRAAEEGILFRGEDAVEQASRVDMVLTDKTGTLTRGRPELRDVVPSPGVTTDELLSLAAAVEAVSEHPFGRAVVEAAESRHLKVPSAEAIRADPGKGVRALVAGTPVSVLNERGAREEGTDFSALRATTDALTAEGKAWSVVLRARQLAGVLGFSDELAPGAAEAVRALAGDGIPVVMVTGDHEAAARAVAQAVGIAEVHAGLTPQGKLDLIREFQAQGRRVAYVGDGINDAPALASADLGVAIGAGTEVAREAGRVVLVRSDLRGVALALRVGRRTVRKVRGNLTWAIGYNSVLLPIAMGALVPLWGLSVYSVLPIVGALAMGLSSTTVVANSWSLRWVRLGRTASPPPSRAAVTH